MSLLPQLERKGGARTGGTTGTPLASILRLFMGEQAEPQPAVEPEPPALTLPELEDILAGIDKTAVGLTSDARLLMAARNLMDDCRAIGQGNAPTAMALAQHLSRSIPSYVKGVS
jgi:hypothetical protein